MSQFAVKNLCYVSLGFAMNKVYNLVQPESKISDDMVKYKQNPQ